MELLSPAGSWEAFIAAIENGADAVYLGGQNFSARQSAANFDDKEMNQAVEYAHLRKKKVYVTVNTLVDRREFSAALDFIFRLREMGVDGVIVQDLGLMDAISATLPDFRVHASTQMTIHNAAGAAFLFSRGVRRVVLARELSAADLRAIRAALPEGELEVFVHGALCYSYSGQCLFSSLVGGRSGNRGRCAQPCRLPYQLWAGSGAKGKEVSLPSAGKHLLSPADLCLLEYLDILQESGVDSLKIEGRMKRPEYVAVVTRSYRQALNSLVAGKQTNPAAAVKDLLKVFNRKFSTGYFLPDRGQFLSTNRPNNRGVFLGRVIHQAKDGWAKIKLADELNLGDGLEVWVSRGKGPAFSVQEIKQEEKALIHAQAGEEVDIFIHGRVSPGDRVFKTHDEELLAGVAGKTQDSQLWVDARVEIKEGEPLHLCLCDAEGNLVQADGQVKAVIARERPLNKTVLRGKMARMGDTPFRLRDLELQAAEGLLVPFSDINATRRRATEKLLRTRLAPFSYPEIEPEEYEQRKSTYQEGCLRERLSQAKPILSIAVSGLPQARAALRSGIGRLLFALEGIGEKQRAGFDEIKEIMDTAAEKQVEVIPLLPRIQKPGEMEEWDFLGQLTDQVMVANPGALQWALNKGFKPYGDYSLNIFNPYSWDFLNRNGLSGACLSPELNYTQLKGFGPRGGLEMIIHGELILMVSEYCILGGLLHPEKDACPGCCRQQDYFLKDERGYSFPVATDPCCRFYLFNSRTLCLMEELDKILTLGLESLRIEARRFTPHQVEETVKVYRQALTTLTSAKEAPLHSLRERLENISPSPFSRYHFHRGVL